MPDLRRLRDDVGAFAEEVARKLSGAQLAAAMLSSLITVLLAPRQGGKSRTLSVLATWWAFRKPGQVVLLVSAGEDASKRLLAAIRKLIAESPLLAGSVVEESTSLIRLSNGSEIRSVPASERAIRGWTVDLLIVDEAIRVPDEIIVSAALPTVAARASSGARIVMADVAGPAQGVFYDMAARGLAGDGEIVTRRWSLEDCPWISPSYLAAMRESMSGLRFAAEFECEFAGESDALVSRKMLEAVTVDYVPAQLGGLVGPARMMAGVDWGATRDRSAFVSVGRLPEAGDLVFGVSCAKAWPSGWTLMGDDGVAAEIARSPAALEWLTSEVVGLGAPSTQELWRRLTLRDAALGGGRRERRPWQASTIGVDGQVQAPAGGFAPRPYGFVTQRRTVHTSAPVKAAIYGALRGLIERRQLLLPASAGDLWRELLMLRVDLSPTGAERIEARSGHDDLADALGFALGPYQSKTGGWRSVVFDLAVGAMPAYPTVRVDPPAPDVAVAAPGGGSAVSRVPVWQSIAGGDLSRPGERPLPVVLPGSDEEVEREGWVVDRRAGARYLRRRTDVEIEAAAAAEG